VAGGTVYVVFAGQMSGATEMALVIRPRGRSGWLRRAVGEMRDDGHRFGAI